ncbi:LamG-like jellyroll fold domain-containing protein [Ekhidna sp.]
MKKNLILFLLVIITTQVHAQWRFFMTWGNGAITITRTAGDSGVDSPTHLDILRSTTGAFGSFTQIASLPYSSSGNYDWVDPEAVDETLYYYKVRERNDRSGIIGPLTIDSRLGQALLRPAQLSVFPGDEKVRVTGTFPDGRSGRWAQAELYRGTTNPPTNLHASVPMPNGRSFDWVDTQVENDVRYYYRLKIIRDWSIGSETPFSSVVEAVPMGSPFGPIAAIAYTDSVSVRWIGDVDLPNDAVRSYEVWRKVGDETLQLLTTVAKEDTSYMDKSVTSGEVYTYEVRSIKNSVLRSETDVVKPAKDFDRNLILDGTGEIQISDAGLFSGNNSSGTIEFRMKAAANDITSTNGHSILSKHDQGGSLNGFNFLLTNSGLRVDIKDGDGNVQRITAHNNTDVADDQWHHVALSYSWGGVTTLYIDGEDQGTINNTPMINLSAEPFRVGGSPDSFWEPFVGMIDELRVWDQALNQTTISNLQGKRVLGDEQWLSGVWRFDLPLTEGVVYDDGVNSFNGIVQGNLTLSDPESSTAYASYDNGEVTLNWDFQLNTPITDFLITRRQIGSADDPVGNPIFIQNPVTSAASGSLVDNKPVLMGAEYEYIVEAKNGVTVLATATDVIVANDDLGGRLFLPSSQNGFVEINEGITNNQTGTIEFRFKSSQVPQAGESVSLLSRHGVSGSNNGYNFIHTASNLYAQIKQGGVSTNLSGTENLLDGEWHHVALVHDWNGVNQLYIDGVLVATETVSNISIADEPLRIGKSIDDFWSSYNGQIDELRLWSKQLTASEIMAGKDIRLPGSTTDLAAVWHFDEQKGYSTARDEGANNFDGTLQDGAFFNQDPGALSFSSPTGGFMETAGNGGRMEGAMVITVEGNFFKIPDNPERLIASNLFNFPQKIIVRPPTGGSFQADLTEGLTPLLQVSPDGTSATLQFEGQADHHIAEYSIIDFRIELNSDVFLTDNAVIGSNGGNTGIPYTLRDNTIPTLTNPISDIEIAADDHAMDLNLDNYFFDPDFDQNLEYIIETNNDIVSTSLVGSLLLFGPTAAGSGSTEIQVTLIDNNGGEVSDTFIVDITKLQQFIYLDPIPILDLANGDNQILLSATATSGLPVQFDLVSGDASIDSNIITVNSVGLFEVSVSQAGDETYEPAETLTVLFTVVDSRRDDQIITFTSDLTGLTYGDAAITLTASASSGLDVSYNSTGPVEINGTTLSILGAGEASVTINQSGNENYNPAIVIINFTIEKKLLVATADDKIMTFGDDLPGFTISYTGFVQGEDEMDIDVLPELRSLATVSSDVGIYNIEVFDEGFDDNYTFDHVSGTLTINKADQVIIFTPPADLDIAQTDRITLSASSASGLDIRFELLEGIGTIQENVVTADETGVFRIMAIQEGNINYNPATPVIQSLIVTDSNKENQTITFEQITDAVYGDVIELNATSSSDMSVNLEVLSGQGILSGNILTLTGLGSYEIEATQEGSSEFNPAPIVTMSFEVSKATLTITAEDKTIAEGDAIPELTISYDGFKLDEDASVLEAEPSASTTATASNPAGVYAIVLTGGSDDLYELNLVDGILTIESEPVLGVVDVEVRVYPNPVIHKLQVKGGEIERMRLLTMDGKLLQSLENASTMDVSNLKQGNYILQLIERKGEISTHLIIKN